MYEPKGKAVNCKYRDQSSLILDLCFAVHVLKFDEVSKIYNNTVLSLIV